MFLFRLAILALATAYVSLSAAAVDEAKAAVAQMAGLAKVAGQVLRDEGGVPTARIPTPGGVTTVSMLKAGGAWLAVIQPPAGAALDLGPVWPGLAADALGDSRVVPVAVIVSTAEAALDASQIPDPARKALGATRLNLKAGGNLILDVAVGHHGALAQVRSAIGAGDQPIRITGICGPELAARLLGDAGPAGAPPASCSLSAAFPAATPPLFAGQEESVFAVRFPSTRIDLGIQGAVLSLGGEQRVAVRVMGKEVLLANALTLTKSGDRYTIGCRGSANLADDLLGTRKAGFDLKQLTLSGDLASDGGHRLSGFGMGIGAVVDIAGVGQVQGDFAITVAEQKVTELSLALQTAPGSSIGLGGLPGIKALPGAKEFAFTQLGLGVSPASKEAFVYGALTWPKQQITAQAALLLANAASGPAVALFLQSDGLTLRKLCPAIPASFDIVPLDHAVVAISSAPIADRSPAMLPSPVRRMLASISGSTDGRLSFSDGLTIVTSYTPGAQMGETMTALGLGRDPMVLAGSVGGVFSGDPSFALYADLGRLPMPKGGRPGCIAVKQVTPRFFLAAHDLASAPALDAGCEVLAGVRLGDDDLTMGLKTYLTLGQAGAGVRISGTVAGLWRDMLGIKAMDIGNLALLFGVDADGSARIGLGGQLGFDGLTYASQGLLSVTPAGVPKLFGLAFRGDRFSPSIMLRMMEAFVRSAATGPLANAISDPTMRRNLATIANGPSLVDAMGKAVPLDLIAVQGVKVFLATPGATDPDLPALNGMGIGVAGTLVLDERIRAAKTDCFLTEAMGLRISGQLADVDLGLVALKSTNLDVRVPMPLQGTPYFKLRGDSHVLLYDGSLDVELSAGKAKFVCRNDWGAFGKANIRAETLGGTILKPKDFILELEASLDLQNGIRKQLAPAITQELAAAGADEDKAYAAAKADLVGLEKQLAAARSEAGKTKADSESAIRAAQKNLDRWDDRLDDIDDDIDDVRDDIETAKDKAEVDTVISLGAKLGTLYSKRTAAKASYAAAKATLAEARKATKVVPVDLFPEVVAARSEVQAKQAEVDSLACARAANAEMSALAAAISAAANDIPLAIEEMSFKDGRLSSAAAGKPQTLRLKLRLNRPGKEPLLLDETLRVNLLKPGEMDLRPLARALRDAIAEAERMKANQDQVERKRTKPKRSKK